jgi:DNA ligase-1
LRYLIVAEHYSKLDAITSRNEMTAILASLLKETPIDELPPLVYLTQGKLRPDYEGVEIGLAEKLAIRALVIATGLPTQRVTKVYQELGDIGSATEELLKSRSQGTLYSQPLTLERVYDTLFKIARQTGQGSIELKLKEVVSLLNDGTALEAKYIMRTATGELRLGVADYTVLDAASVAFLGGKEFRSYLERAYSVSSDLGFVVQLAAKRGLKGLAEVKVQVGRPIRPMLAERLESAKAIIEKMGGAAAAEYKLDGERLQIHKDGEIVKLFSRRLEDITSHYPDAIDLVKKHVKARRAILEAEVVAINQETGDYLPFQELMHRRRKYGVEEAMRRYPVALNLFDLLFLEGKDLTNEPYTKRRRTLETVISPAERARPVPSIVSSDPAEVEKFMQKAITEGCEGLVVKDLKGPYRAGAREFSWIKLKREYASELTDTLDLVIVGAFHGRGRRAGSYGAYLLAAYDKDKGKFPSVSKIGTGFSDQDLEKFPKMLKPYESHVKPPEVESNLKPDIWFRPKIVIETIASEITLSPIHPAGFNSVRKGSGLALRFPKFTGKIRDDKAPEDATTVQELVKIYKMQLKKIQRSS